MSNPLRKASRASADNEFIVLPAGTYEAMLNSIKVKQRKKYQSEEMEDVLRFQFDIETEGGVAHAYKMVRPIVGDSTNLIALARQLSPTLSAETLSNLDATWEALQKLQGKTYLLSITPDKSGKFNDIVAIIPPVAKPATVKQAVKQTALDVDTIPF